MSIETTFPEAGTTSRTISNNDKVLLVVSSLVGCGNSCSDMFKYKKKVCIYNDKSQVCI